MSMGRKLQDLLREKPYLYTLGITTPLHAMIVEKTGYDYIYVGGYDVSLTLLGLPDVGLITEPEMVTNAGHIGRSVKLPVMVDADTGYGNAINVIRTVREYELAGVAAIHLEDQVSPKRCGSIAGKEVIPVEEACGKIRAAVDARTDPDFVVIARTDARGATGFADAVLRGQRYHEAGADMVFPDALLSVEEYATFAREVPGLKMFNMGGYAKKRTTPKLPLDEVEGMGYALCILPLLALRAGVQAMIDTLDGFLREMKMRFPDAVARAKLPPGISADPDSTGSLPAIVGSKPAGVKVKAGP